MNLLPVFLRVERRHCLVIGAGTVALAKIESLLVAGAKITVVAPEADRRVQEMTMAGRVVWHQRLFAATDLEETFLVIAATNDSAVNRLVYEEALRRNVICNAVDDPPNCDFYFGSVVARGDLQIAISTAGKSPSLAQRLRQEIDEQLPIDLGPWLMELGELRNEVRTVAPAGDGRNLLLHELVQRQLCVLPECPTRQMAIKRAAAIKKAEVRR